MDFNIKLKEFTGQFMPEMFFDQIIDNVITKMFDDGLSSKYTTYQDCLKDDNLRETVYQNILNGMIIVHISESDINY